MIFAYKSQAIVQHIDRVGELQPFWDCPSPPPFELQSRYNLNINKGPPLFMRYVEIYEDIAGITVACKNGLVHMLSHRRQSPQPLSVYARTESTGDGLVWVYFPMGRGESISAVWICEIAGDSYVRSPTIILRTSHGRHVHFGPCVQKHEHPLFIFHRLSCTPAQATGFCFNNLGVRGTSDFVFAVSHTSEGFHTTRQDHCPIPPTFIGEPRQYVVGEWFYSEACLNGLTELQLCRDRSHRNSPCIGMLLTYSDGHFESLGQWRSDFAADVVRPASRFCICTVREGNTSYVRHVRLSKRESSELEEAWFDVSVHDTLSWWFNSQNAEIFIKPQ